MRPSKSFVVRIVIYSVGLVYLAGDLFLFHGPVSRRLRSARPGTPEWRDEARRQGIVARVFGHSIYLSQVERAARERIWLRGLSMEELTPDQRRSERLAALNELIDHTLLRVKVQYNMNEFPVPDEEVDAAVARLESRYPSPEALLADLKAEGIDSRKELRMRLAARLQQVKYLESRMADGVAVSEEEARAWFAEHADEFAMPLRVRARHIFRGTLSQSSDKAREPLDAALAKLQAGTAGFAALAKELSEDERTKRAGGDLGWMTEDRLPADFGKPVFAMKTGRPELVRTKIGWHLVEVTDRREREPRSFEDAREEVIAALEAWKRLEVVRQFREGLRAQDGIAVHVFPELIGGE